MIITVVRRCNELLEVQKVFLMQRFGEVPDINIQMVAIAYSVVVGLQESWKVMLPVLLTTPFHSTIQTAAMLAVIAYKPSDMHHTQSIGSNQCKEYLRSQFALKCSIPDLQPLLLNGNKMLKPGEQE